VSQLLVAQRALTVPGWAKDALWRRAQAIPSLDLRFADNKSLVDAVTGASLVTFTRASSGTFVDSAGVLQTATNDVPRFDHNPTTGESLGLLVEEQRTNLLLNSGTLSTQSVTVAAVAHTLSFTGTGTVTLTGVSTAGPLVGTGASNRVSLTFTPTVGVLVLTVSGSVTNAQLEAGAFPTSYIPTTAAAVTRSADVASISGSNFSAWYRQDEGTVFADANSPTGGTHVTFDDGTVNTNRVVLYYQSSANPFLFVASAGATSCNINAGAITSNSRALMVGAYKLNDFAASVNGLTPVLDALGNAPTGVDRARLGRSSGDAAYLNGCLRRIVFWPQRLANSTLQQITQ
jgi:hypothetical protein